MAYLQYMLLPFFYPEFWAKKVFQFMTPGGYGYIRKLQSMHDEDQHERNKYQGCDKYYGAGGWS